MENLHLKKALGLMKTLKTEVYAPYENSKNIKIQVKVRVRKR